MELKWPVHHGIVFVVSLVKELIRIKRMHTFVMMVGFVSQVIKTGINRNQQKNGISYFHPRKGKAGLGNRR